MASRWQDTWARLFEEVDFAKERAKVDFLARLSPPNPDRIPADKRIALIDAITTAQWRALMRHIGPTSSDGSIEIGTSVVDGVQQLDLCVAGTNFYTVAEIDFATLPAQNLLVGGDGVKVIKGASCVLHNSANLATAYINDGTHSGLYLRTNTNVSENANGSITGGALTIPFDQFIAWKPANYVSYGTSLETWVWFYYEIPHTPAANKDGAGVGVLTTSNIDFTLDHTLRYNQYDTYYTADGLQQRRAHLQAGSAADGWGPAVGPTYDVLCVRWRYPSYTFFSGKSVNGGFPSRSTLINPRIALELLPDGNGYNGGFLSHHAWLGVQSGGSGLQDILLHKIRVESVALVQPRASTAVTNISSTDEPYAEVYVVDGVIGEFGAARNLMCMSSGATLAGLATDSAAGGARVRVTFKYATTITAMGAPSSGAPVKTPRMGADTPQDLHVAADDVVELQLRTDTETPFWKVTGGSFL